MRIALLISRLHGGGAERVMSILASHWAQRGEDVTLVTLDAVRAEDYVLHPDVARIGLGLSGATAGAAAAAAVNLRRLRAIRDAVAGARPEVVLSFSTHMNVRTLMATMGLAVPVIVSEHNDPRERPPGALWERLRNLLYRRAAAVVVLTAELREVASAYAPEDRLWVVPNPALPAPAGSAAAATPLPSGPFIAAMGRLSPNKGFDLLLRAFAACEAPGWSLLVMGEGAERRRLEALVRELGLCGRVELAGWVERPAAVLSRADMFVLSSRDEGFPMALVEAMAAGLAVISFDCPTGPADIIDDGVDGILVPRGDIAGLAAAMTRLAADDALRRRLAARAPAVTERFGVEAVMARWDAVLRAALARSRRAAGEAA